MKQIRISKRPRADRSWLEPLPLDVRDPDVVRAKRLARQAGPSQRRPQPKQD
jgi:hypothetical protein